ncbi:hypothetical protein AB0I91_04945 [Actinosynnema sp. NPDC049800]
MRVLGINGTKDGLYLAVADHGTVIDVEPYVLQLPAGLDPGRQLPAFKGYAEKFVETHKITQVRLLQAEPSYSASYISFVDRVSMETLFLLACTEKGVDFQRLTRSRVRSILELEKRGPLTKAGEAINPKVGPHWANKRDLAALAALAGSREAS